MIRIRFWLAVAAIVFVIGALLAHLILFGIHLHGSRLLVFLPTIGGILMLASAFEIMWILAMRW